MRHRLSGPLVLHQKFLVLPQIPQSPQLTVIPFERAQHFFFLHLLGPRITSPFSHLWYLSPNTPLQHPNLYLQAETEGMEKSTFVLEERNSAGALLGFNCLLVMLSSKHPSICCYYYRNTSTRSRTFHGWEWYDRKKIGKAESIFFSVWLREVRNTTISVIYCWITNCHKPRSFKLLFIISQCPGIKDLVYLGWVIFSGSHNIAMEVLVRAGSLIWDSEFSSKSMSFATEGLIVTCFLKASSSISLTSSISHF